jgi:hypothetical protein
MAASGNYVSDCQGWRSSLCRVCIVSDYSKITQQNNRISYVL